MTWSAWSGPPGDSAIEINRIDVIVIVVILAGLPWIVRRVRGPVADGRLARPVRIGGYAVILALVLAKSAVERVADAEGHQRVPAAALDDGEHPEQRGDGRDRADGPGRAPARLLGRDHHVDEQQHRGGDGQRTGQVEFAGRSDLPVRRGG